MARLPIVEIGGVRCVEVALVGSGAGRRMVLEALRWPTIRRDLGRRWTIRRSSDGREVVTGPRRARRRLGAPPVMISTPLARLIAYAKAYETVRPLNGDGLDLRAANLCVRNTLTGQTRRGDWQPIGA